MKNGLIWNLICNRRVTALVCASLLSVGGTSAFAQLSPGSYTSLGTLTAVSGDTVSINTTTGVITINGNPTFTGVTQTQAGAGSIKVFNFDNINIGTGVTLNVTGSNALALLSKGSATIQSNLFLSGNAGNANLGSTIAGTAILGGGNGGSGTAVPGATAGAGVSTLNNNGALPFVNPDPNNGLQDGAGGGLGGPGGAANSTAGAAVGVSPLSKLVGGGGGSGGAYAATTMQGAQPGAGGGAGGGAIEIIATGALSVNNIVTDGGNGGGVQPVDGGLQYGGGGAGGAVVLGGSTLTVNGFLSANGGAAVNGTNSGAGGGGEVALLGTPNWVLGSTDVQTGLGINARVNRGTGGSASGTAGTIEAVTLGVTAPIGQTATFDGTNFTNIIPVQQQNAATPAIIITLGRNLVLAGGTLQFTTANGTFGPSNTFQLAADSTIDTQGNNNTISSVITGPGAFNKIGTGSLTLTNNNTFTGSIEIDNGTLVVANAGALGSGGLTEQAGVLKTGGSNHAINIGGGWNMAGGELVLNLNAAPGAASNDIVNVTGAANLDGNLTLNYSAGAIPAGTTRVYTVVTTTGGVTTSGTGFTNPTFNSGALIFNVSGAVANGGNDFDITITSTQGLFNTISGLTPNQHSTATYIDRVNASGVTNPGLASLVTNLDTVSVDSVALGAALNQLTTLNFAHFASSSAFNGTDYLVEQMDNYFAGHRQPDGSFIANNSGLDFSGLSVGDANTATGLQAVHSRLLAWSPTPTPGLLSDSTPALFGGVDMRDTKKMVTTTDSANLWNVFIAGDVVLGQDFSDNFTGNAHSDSTTGEVRIGADYAITPHFIIGGLMNYAHTDVTLDAQKSKATTDGYMPGVYASYAQNGWYANAIGTYSFNAYTQHRNVDIAGFKGTADSAPTGGQTLGDLDTGYDFHCGQLTFGPTAGIKYIHLDIDGYSETGLPSANLDVNRDEADSLRTRLGGRVSYAFHDLDRTYTPHFDISWLHEFLDGNRILNSAFSGVGAGTFITRTASPSRDSALMTLGLDAKISNCATIFTNYTVQAGQENYFGQSAQLGVKIGF